MEPDHYHEPVLLNETTGFLLEKANQDIAIKSNYISSKGFKRVFVDCTLGGGGYTRKILELTGNDTAVIAIDRDKFAIEYSRQVLSKYSSRIIFLQRNFSEISSIVHDAGFEKIDGITMDLGLSTYQLNHEEGFSYQRNTELDMRADKTQKLNAKDVLNTYSERELEEIFRKFGELKYSRHIAKEIVNSRKSRKLETTFDLVEIASQKIPPRYLNSDLAKIFQAVRIEVNNELKNLEKVLNDSIELLNDGSRIAAVSYHSLEDRIVKNIYRSSKKLKVLTKKPVLPGAEEVEKNVRSRSAKLRAAEKSSEIILSKNKYKDKILR
ncbi:MAG: 16S rRNA (cytosine(1402)-N(4))-methyltransferase RsmH [Ignavibacteria bacterium]|nr:16S rRNA (cytosine(1402)-N(4))-methyltransferase RsmH [Ignavibacteria bacterium]